MSDKQLELECEDGSCAAAAPAPLTTKVRIVVYESGQALAPHLVEVTLRALTKGTTPWRRTLPVTAGHSWPLSARRRAATA